ncbi:MAG: transcription elongation factor GreA, partial [Patescibacteria group bacterium]
MLITKEGLRKLKDELKELKTVKRKEIAERLKEAISYGDLSENAEYEEAKNEQAFIEGRVLDLEKKIKRAKIISEKHDGKSKMVDIGCMVTVLERGGRGEPETYTIVGSTEANPIEHLISNESPIGRALLGRMRGDVVDVQAPGG